MMRLNSKLFSIFLCFCLFMAGVVQASDNLSTILANQRYVGVAKEPVKLIDGIYESEPHDPDGASRLRIGLAKNFMIKGDLGGDGTEEVAVLLWKSSGGSGTELYCAILDRLAEGLENTATLSLGDRVQLVSGKIAGGILELDLIRHGPDDPMCCPSQRVKRSWTLTGNKLVEQAEKNLGTVDLDILGENTWQLDKMGSGEDAVDFPRITLSYENGRFKGNGGCNDYSAGVTSGEMPGDLKVGALFSTRMSCGEHIDQIEQGFISALENVMTYRFLAGKLALTWQQGGTFNFLQFSPVSNSE